MFGENQPVFHLWTGVTYYIALELKTSFLDCSVFWTIVFKLYVFLNLVVWNFQLRIHFCHAECIYSQWQNQEALC